MLSYLAVFAVSLLVDIIPFFGPPAWTVMVFFQIKYGLNIWLVLIAGVAGSAVGRYILSLYMPLLFDGVLADGKKDDLRFVGSKLAQRGWKVQLFVFLYTLVPLPSWPLFTASGMARVSAMNVIPAFVAGKFVSDMIMVLSGDYAARNAISIAEGDFTWRSMVGVIAGLIIIAAFLFTDWRYVLRHKRLRFSFRIWK